MDKRLQLQAVLEGVLGSRNVYFQPPPNVKMNYPCIVYKRDSALTDYASNNPYRFKQRYLLTVIDRDPDSSIIKKVAALQTASYIRNYSADGLNHDLFNLYF